MKLDQAKQLIEVYLQAQLKELSLSPDLHQWLEYVLLPLGKSVRGALSLSLIEDFHITAQQEHINWAALVEIHHAYTLVHDDLPAMDNALERRGRPSCHKKFGEWQAVLTGDALLNLSYQLMGHYSYPNIDKVLKEATPLLNQTGIIQGQIEDLQTTEPDWSQIQLIHHKKTATLFEFTLFSTSLICDQVEKAKDLRALGIKLGLLFQALDDYLDRNDKDEKINLFHQHSNRAGTYLKELKNDYDQLVAPYPKVKETGEEVLQSFKTKISEDDWNQLF